MVFLFCPISRGDNFISMSEFMKSFDHYIFVGNQTSFDNDIVSYFRSQFDHTPFCNTIGSYDEYVSAPLFNRDCFIGDYDCRFPNIEQ